MSENASKTVINQHGYCCPAKEYLCRDNMLINTLEISPRVIIYKKKLNVKASYEQIITIKNTGLHPRCLKYYTDSLVDTKIKISKTFHHKYLESDETILIRILISPKEKKNINRIRNFYIEAEHPYIVFEVPIIVLNKDTTIYLPETITFPHSAPKAKSHYEFAVYNSSTQWTNIIAKITNKNLSVKISADKIPAKDYVKIVLILTVNDLTPFNDQLKLKFGNGNFHLGIQLLHSPVPATFFISISHLQFEEVKFEREDKNEFSVCNESDVTIKYNITFLTEQSQLELSDEEELDNYVQETRSQTSLQSYISPEISTNSFLPAIPSEETLDLKAYKHFSTNEKIGELKPNTCTNFTVIFRPIMDNNCDFNDDQDPPFTMRTKLFFTITKELFMEQKSFTVMGIIKGPDMEFSPKTIDFRKIYMGEEHCEQIKVLNVDGIVTTSVLFKDYSPKDMAIVTVKPKNGHMLQSCRSDVFNISFFTRMIGKFIVKLRFKVKNGAHYNVIVRGTSQQVRVKVYPDMLEYGSVPIAVPQKRYILLMNPLSVPLCVQCFPAEDGEETPLVLNIRDVDEILPITVKDPKFQREDIIDPSEDDYPQVVLTNVVSSEDSFRSVNEENSSYSTSFVDEILDPIPDFANYVVSNIKKKRFLEKTEAEKRTIEEGLKCLLYTEYFSDLIKYNNYAQMDWNNLPSDPKEIYCDSEIIYLNPNTGKSITVLLIPNSVGYFNRALNIRVCPINEFYNDGGEFKSEMDHLVKSKLLTSKLWLEYYCRVPDIEWNDNISFLDRTIYAGEKYDFNMEFENYSNVGGFIYYDVVPRSEDGEMSFTDSTWKHYSRPDNVLTIPCRIVFKKIGHIKLSGVVKLLGNITGIPFHITAKVLPAKIRIEPNYVYHRQNVMDLTKVFVFIYNVTPTSTWLRFSLKHTKYQHIEPYGALLAPTNQGTYITIYSKYYDPELYKNTLLIRMEFGNPIEVPITYNIEGMPIYFEPNIKGGFNAGIILTNSKDNYKAELPNFSKIIKVINRGERCYQLKISKLKSGKSSTSTCVEHSVKGRLNVTPKILLLKPGIEDLLEITANACEETTVYNEFRVEIVDQCNKQRVLNFRFVVTAKFIEPEISWSRKEIYMEYRRTHKFKEHPQLELVHLTNISNVEIESVNLKILGPFKIKELFEQNFAKELNFKMGGLEKKELTILLNKPALRDESFGDVDGRLLCMANSKLQRPLLLKIKIFHPELRILQPDLVLFTKDVESYAMLDIENIGCLEAHYKWKKIQETVKYISEYDDAYEFARTILSDIFQMLDLNEDCEYEMDSLYERNMTLWYQKYRCKLRKMDDPIGVLDIINEIFDNLDLEQKRYKIKLEKVCDDACAYKLEQISSESCVKNTLEQVLDALNLEDSYEISEESSEDCLKERTVYFYEKTGILMQNEKAQCMIHLPAVKKGYVCNAYFTLDVVGSCPQRFNLTLVNLDKAIELSKDSIYLGMRPWYELFKFSVNLRNVTQYDINFSIKETDQPKQRLRIPRGYIKVVSNKVLNLSQHECKRVKAEGILGFSEEFIRDIKIVINGGNEKLIRVRGQGIMPILSVTSKLSRPEQYPYDIIEEYQLLQRVYYFDIFRGITEIDEELVITKEEEDLKENLSFIMEYSQISLHSTSSTSTRTGEVRFFKLMKSYVLVNNNEELPNALVLEQLLETEKFLKQLNANGDTNTLLHMVYQDYVKFLSVYDEKMPINLKHFTTQPLPFELHGYVLNMNEMRVNQFRKFEFNVLFLGPGKLIATARTIVKIPGLVVDFEVKNSEDKEFIYYQAEEKAPDLFDKPYRNMYERTVDMDTDPKLKHAHSFDIDQHSKHERERSAKERKHINNYYNSLNKSVYMEHKHHYILCKIFTNSKQNFSAINMRVSVLVKPQSKFYEEGQLIEDYLYIDLHLGPTLPILLRGLITKR